MSESRRHRYLRCGIRVGGGVTCGLRLHHDGPHLLFVNCDRCGIPTCIKERSVDSIDFFFCVKCRRER